MSIDPRLLQAPGDVPQIYTTVSDLDRRVRMLEGARSVIGAGTITGGTGGMVGTGTITGSNVGSGTITGTNIVAGTITATQIQAGSITATLIAADAINAGHIQAGAVTASEIAANTITAANIQAGTITSTEIAAGSIIAADIQAHTLTANEIAASTITTTEIAASTIVAGDIAANTITAGQIATNAITTVEIAAATITGGDIAANTITGGNIAANTITGGNLIAGTITATEIGVSSLSAISANLGTITAGTISGTTITGATVRTSGSNPRIEMVPTSLRSYDGSGVVTFEVDAVTGKVTTLAGIGSGNMQRNSSFEDITQSTTYSVNPWPGWVLNSPSTSEEARVLSTTGSLHGSNHLGLRRKAGAGAGVVIAFTANADRPVAVAGQAWSASAYFKGAATTTYTARIRIRFYDTFGSTLGTVLFAPTSNGVSIPAGTAWTRLTLENAVAPASTASVQLLVECTTNMPELEAFLIDGTQLELGTLATGYGPKIGEILPQTVSGGGSTGEIVPGTIIGSDLVVNTITATQIQASTITTVELAAATITAGNIAANTITGGNIAGATITADKLTVSNLAAITANLGSIVTGVLTGVTITGSTVQTGATGARVVLNGTGLRAYNASNALTTNIPTSGSAQFTGALNADGGITQDAIIASPPASTRKHAWLDSSESEVAAIFGATSAFPGTATQRLFASATAPMSYTTLIKAHANLKHYYKLNSSTTANDSVTSGAVNLTSIFDRAINTTGLISGTDTALTNGDTTAGTPSFAYFSSGVPPSENVTTGLSIEYWVRIAALPAADVRLFTRSNSSSGASAEYYKSTYIAASGKVQFSILIGGVAKTILGATVLAVNTTYHVVHTYDGANMRTYLNGVADATAVAQTGSIDAQGTTQFKAGIIRTSEWEGPKFPSVGVTQANAGVAWTNPGNATASDNTYATCALISGQISDYLAVGGFGFTVPTGAIITGLVSEIEAKAATGGPKPNIVANLRTDYTLLVELYGLLTSPTLSTTDTFYTHGATTDTWGHPWTAAEVNSANFGMSYRFQHVGANNTYSVDAVRLTIYYYTQLTLDEVALYNAALSTTVITDHYQTGTTGISTSTASVTKSVIGADYSSDFVVAKGEHVKASKNATTACANAADTLIAWNTEFYDITADGANAMHDLVTNNSRLTARIAGLYIIYGCWQMSVAGAGHPLVRRNAAGVAGGGTLIHSGALSGPTTYTEVDFSFVAQLAAGDHVEVWMRNDSGASRNVLAASGEVGHFGMSRIGTVV